jgi:IS605 OrfB family transposase
MLADRLDKALKRYTAFKAVGKAVGFPRFKAPNRFKVAKHYAEQFTTIFVEDLNIQGMVRNHSISKSILDAGWGQFLAILDDKAASAGGRVMRVPPHYTTQRTHICTMCGYIAARDLNAAINILQGGARPSGTLGSSPADEPRSRRREATELSPRSASRRG